MKKKIEVGPVARETLFGLFMNGARTDAEPLTLEEWMAVCLVIGLQVVLMRRTTPGFEEEAREMIVEAARRTGLNAIQVDSRNIVGGG